MAFSANGLYDINLADAKVALTVWTRRLGERLGVTLTMSPKVFESTEEILARLQRKTVDAVAVSIHEYPLVANYLDPSRFLAEGETKDRQYVLVVKKNSGIEAPIGLQGRTVTLWRQLKMSMARPWFSTILYEGKKAPYEPFRVSIIEEPKALRAVLPVFFGKADACLTNRSTFEGIVELNPQVGKELKILASSPPLVTSVYMFRKGFSLTRRNQLLNILSGFEQDAGLRQVMNLFKSGALISLDSSALKTTLELLDAAKNLPGGADSKSRKG